MKNSRGGTGLARDERLQIMLSPEELKAVDNFRIPSSHAEPSGSRSRVASIRNCERWGSGGEPRYQVW